MSASTDWGHSVIGSAAVTPLSEVVRVVGSPIVGHSWPPSASACKVRQADGPFPGGGAGRAWNANSVTITHVVYHLASKHMT
jgi:hypothetical protein